MKKFIKTLTIFLLPIIILIFIMEIGLRLIDNNYSFKKDYLEENAEEIETLILGSSHSYYGLNPELFTSKTFNTAYIYQDLYFDNKIFQKYQDDLINLKTLIVPISYVSYFGDIKHSQAAWRADYYDLYADVGSENKLYQSALWSTSIDYSTRQLMTHYVRRESLVTCSDLGWGSSSVKFNIKRLDNTGKIAAGRHTVDFSNPQAEILFNENMTIIKSMLNWCKENQVEIILYTSPAYHSYYSELNPDQLQKTISISQNFAKEYENCTYINLLNDQKFVATDFFDADHLSESGAKKLSPIINQIVEERQKEKNN